MTPLDAKIKSQKTLRRISMGLSLLAKTGDQTEKLHIIELRLLFFKRNEQFIQQYNKGITRSMSQTLSLVRYLLYRRSRQRRKHFLVLQWRSLKKTLEQGPAPSIRGKHSNNTKGTKKKRNVVTRFVCFIIWSISGCSQLEIQCRV